MRLVLITLLMVSLCSTAFAKLSVFVSILPQKYFVDKIAGDLVDVSVMVAPGSSPATYEPKPKQMAMLSKADIYFSVGVPFERVWLKKFTALSKDMTLVRTDGNIYKRDMAAHKHEHKEGEDCKHDHHHHKGGIKDPHVWLSPKLVKIQAENMYLALIKADAKNSAQYKSGYESFLKEIDNTDAAIRKVVQKGKTFMVFHPSWGYFADDYGLKQVAVEKSGKAPKPAELSKFVKHVKELKLKTIFVQPQFSKKEAGVIAKETGARVVAVNPLALNWSENLIKVGKALSE